MKKIGIVLISVFGLLLVGAGVEAFGLSITGCLDFKFSLFGWIIQVAYGLLVLGLGLLTADTWLESAINYK